MGVWRKSKDLWTRAFDPGYRDNAHSLPGKVTHAPVTWIEGRLSFQGGLPCPSFCGSNANTRHRIVDVAHCRKTSLTTTTNHRSKPGCMAYAAAMVDGYPNTRSKHAVSAPGMWLCEWQQKNTPILKRMVGKCLPVLCICVISNVDIDILMDNSL